LLFLHRLISANVSRAPHRRSPATIREHEFKYYVLDQPVISDFEFDQLMRDLKALKKSTRN
jgi:DNA ligase (NAD+)